MRFGTLGSATDNDLVEYAIKNDVEVLLITSDEDEQMFSATSAYQNVSFKALEKADVDQVVSVCNRLANGENVEVVFRKIEKCCLVCCAFAMFDFLHL